MTKKSPEQIAQLGRRLYESMHSCALCPHECLVDRFESPTGMCKSPAELHIASINLHFGEEPPLSGGGGSGTVFLSGCSLFCKYCQNYPISQLNTGSPYTVERLAERMLELQKRGADNINFVTPDHMLPMILMAVGQAQNGGLTIPLVYNCSGYQKLEILKELDGIIDIYLADMRYNDDHVAKKYSGCENYVATNRAAIAEMFRQVGLLEMDERGMAQKGLIVRHLVLPGGLSGSEGIFEFLARELSPEVYVSLMSQYFPAFKAPEDPVIRRRITPDEFRTAREAFERAGLGNGFIQYLENETV